MEQAPDIRSSYRYWQEHGEEWITEYDRRKESIPLYHVQELMLATYLAYSAPARVLEYGCGVGRHLRYLRDLPDIEVFGFDQSPTMVRGLADWASDAWIAERVAVGSAVGRLPYPDRHFDIVFTAEVLVHVHPEDIEVILAELLRVARWQVLHLEPPSDYVVHRDAHAGCWAHDLPAAYLRLGQHCEVLPAGYGAHAPYRVVLKPERPLWTWAPVVLALCRRLERDLTRGFDERDQRARSAEAERERLAGMAAELHHQLDTERDRAVLLDRQLRDLQATLSETTRALHMTTVRTDDLERRLRRLRASQREFVRSLESVLGRE